MESAGEGGNRDSKKLVRKGGRRLPILCEIRDGGRRVHVSGKWEKSFLLWRPREELFHEFLLSFPLSKFIFVNGRL